MPRSTGCTNDASNDIHKIGKDAPGFCLSCSARIPWTKYADQTDAVLQKDELTLWLERYGATFRVQKAEQQADRGVGFDAPKTKSTVETATSQVDEAAPAAEAVAAEAPDVTVSSERAEAAVMRGAEKAAAAPNIAGLEAPDETASSQEADVTAHEDDSKAAEVEASGETISSWVADVAKKEDVDEAAAAKEADEGQTAQSERQRVYLTQAIVRSVSPRPLVVSSLVCANARRVSVSL